ncbi:MAG TPA: hypothetical protein PK674_01085 [Candidatus Absconditabacterales bacterium]|nr:hypothetical protein [Candidatus Absconditabacterales bacterium]HOQ78810.1 hypothetical protein [Candidatus Absconditabacterales bacterium]
MENPVFFSASILSLQDAQTMTANHWDLAYKNEKNVLDVFVSDTIKNINELSVSIIYDDQDVQIDLDNIKQQCDYEIVSQMGGSLILKFKNFNGKFDYGQSLFELPFGGKEPSILLSEGSVLLLNGNNKTLSIGSLNQNKDSHHGF